MKIRWRRARTASRPDASEWDGVEPLPATNVTVVDCRAVYDADAASYGIRIGGPTPSLSDEAEQWLNPSLSPEDHQWLASLDGTDG